MEEMDNMASRENIALLKEAELLEYYAKKRSEGKTPMQMTVDRILHGQPQGLNVNVFAPIQEIKEKIAG
jgi:hypothetical protein